MRIWNFLIIYSCWSDGGLIDENDTAVDENLGEKKTIFLKDVLPKAEYKVVEKEEKKAKMKEKLKVLSQNIGSLESGPKRTASMYESDGCLSQS